MNRQQVITGLGNGLALAASLGLNELLNDIMASNSLRPSDAYMRQ